MGESFDYRNGDGTAAPKQQITAADYLALTKQARGRGRKAPDREDETRMSPGEVERAVGTTSVLALEAATEARTAAGEVRAMAAEVARLRGELDAMRARVAALEARPPPVAVTVPVPVPVPVPAATWGRPAAPHRTRRLTPADVVAWGVVILGVLFFAACAVS